MDDKWAYPSDVREWLSDFGGEEDDPLTLGTSEQMETFLDECESAVDYYRSRIARAPIDYTLTKLAIRQCETLITTLEKEPEDEMYPQYENDELRIARDLLFSLQLRPIPPTSKSGRPEKTEELILVGRMANAYLKVFNRMPPKSNTSAFAECISKTFETCGIDAQPQNLIYKVIDGKGKNPRWGDAINNLP